MLERGGTYSFWASIMISTLSDTVGLEDGIPRNERKDFPDCGFDILGEEYRFLESRSIL